MAVSCQFRSPCGPEPFCIEPFIDAIEYLVGVFSPELDRLGAGGPASLSKRCAAARGMIPVTRQLLLLIVVELPFVDTDASAQCG